VEPLPSPKPSISGLSRNGVRGRFRRLTDRLTGTRRDRVRSGLERLGLDMRCANRGLLPSGIWSGDIFGVGDLPGRPPCVIPKTLLCVPKHSPKSTKIRQGDKLRKYLVHSCLEVGVRVGPHRRCSADFLPISVSRAHQIDWVSLAALLRPQINLADRFSVYGTYRIPDSTLESDNKHYPF